MLGRIFIAAALLASTAHAQDGDDAMSVPEKARLLADRGRQLQRDGKFAEALEAYKAAYVLAPSPGLLFNLAQAYRLDGDCDDAAWMYRRFLDTNPRDDLRALVNAHLEKLQGCTHVGFRASVDAPNLPREVSPAAMPSQPPRTDVLVGARVDDHPGRGKEKAGAYLMVGGGVALAAAAVFAIDAHLAANDVADAYKGGVRHPDLRALDDRGRRDDTITAVAGITGGLALVGGAVLYGLGRHSDREQHVVVVPHRNGGEVKVAWQF
jgi:tetratricopeptide (TPR) repeat protein